MFSLYIELCFVVIKNFVSDHVSYSMESQSDTDSVKLTVWQEVH